MKNIHILPTDKPSRLFYSDSSKTLMLSSTAVSFRTFERSTQHIYITTNEEIKEGEWFYDNDGEICKYTSDYNINPNKWDDNEKVILTTDHDLIADGVQAIDDEFLEWFVKNPSCEKVEVGYGWIRLTETDNEGYWISIPNEQIEMNQEDTKQDLPIVNGSYGCTIQISKQETLEQAAEKYANKKGHIPTTELEDAIFKQGFIDGAKWQQETLKEATEKLVKLSRQDAFYEGAKWQAERMYSEFIEFGEWIRIKDFQTTSKNNWIGLDMKYYTTQELFEQFKKK